MWRRLSGNRTSRKGWRRLWRRTFAIWRRGTKQLQRAAIAKPHAGAYFENRLRTCVRDRKMRNRFGQFSVGVTRYFLVTCAAFILQPFDVVFAMNIDPTAAVSDVN